jgi:hypothetical protein
MQKRQQLMESFVFNDLDTSARRHAVERVLEELVAGRADLLCPRNRAMLLKKQDQAMQQMLKFFPYESRMQAAVIGEFDEWLDAREFEDFIDWARAAGQEMHEDPLCHLPSNYGWRRWATTEPAPANDPPAAVAADDAFFATGVIKLDSDAVFDKYVGQPLSGAMLHEAALAEHKQALRLQTEYQAREVERRQRDRRQRRDQDRKQILQQLEEQEQEQEQNNAAVQAALWRSQLPA